MEALFAQKAPIIFLHPPRSLYCNHLGKTKQKNHSTFLEGCFMNHRRTCNSRSFLLRKSSKNTCVQRTLMETFLELKATQQGCCVYVFMFTHALQCCTVNCLHQLPPYKIFPNNTIMTTKKKLWLRWPNGWNQNKTEGSKLFGAADGHLSSTSWKCNCKCVDLTLKSKI